MLQIQIAVRLQARVFIDEQLSEASFLSLCQTLKTVIKAFATDIQHIHRMHFLLPIGRQSYGMICNTTNNS